MAEKITPYIGWNYLRNLGDRINPDIMEFVSGTRPVFSRKDENHVLGIGSIFFLANRNSYIWGSGVIGNTFPDVQIDPAKVRAVRGRETADLLVRSGIRIPDVPFGDPGIFISDVVSPMTSDGAAGKPIVIIPHFSAFPAWKNRFADSAEIEILDIATDRLDLTDRIRTADIVISASLHGLIFACAFGKKATWIGEKAHDNFKYYDWFSTTENPLNIFPVHTDIDILTREASLIEHTINKKDLASAFPHEASFFRQNENAVSYRAARSHEYYIAHVTRQELGIPGNMELPLHTMLSHSRSYLASLYENWDEPTYGLVSLRGEGVIPDRQQMQDLLFEMDHHVNHHYAVIISRQQAEKKGLPIHRCGKNLWWTSQVPDCATTLFLRAHYHSPIVGGVTFCV